jgi:hypothetical protein
MHSIKSCDLKGSVDEALEGLGSAQGSAEIVARAVRVMSRDSLQKKRSHGTIFWASISIGCLC